ncbi:MAG TPA: glycosyltransferase family 39 protein [Acidimicrobiales bacterium]
MRRRPALVLVPLALLFLVSGLVQAWRDSPTVDEAIDIAAGVTSVVRHDLRLSPEHDVAIHVLPAVPALFAHPVVPDGPGYQSDDWFEHTDEFIRANQEAGRLQRVVFLSRLVPLMEGLAVAWLLYLLGARLFGTTAGILSSALWLTTPVFIGFSHIVSIDVAFTLATLAVCLALLRFLERPSTGWAAVVAVAVGAALLTRHSALVLLAVVLAVIVIVGWRDGRAPSVWLQHAGIVAFGSWATVWLCVRLLAFTAPGGEAGARLDGYIAQGRHDSLITRLVLSVPWPKEWAAGFAYLVQTSTAKPAYVLGHAWDGGHWWYFLAMVPVKVPFVALIVMVVGPFGWRHVAREKVRLALAVVVAPALALYVAVALQPLDLGLRYAFPPLALWFVAAGPAVLLGTPPLRRVAAAVLGVTQIAAAVAAYPHSIAWTPPPFTPAYQWTTDSNVDYGQDTRLVNEWAVGKQPLVDLLLPRGVDLPAGSRPLLDVPPVEVQGWVAVSATRLTALDRDQLAWLRAYCPVGTIGGSVLLYRFDAPIDPSPGPTKPVGICSGDVSTRTG